MATPAELIAQIYIGFYDRAPDPTGLQYWIGRLAAGVSTADIGDSFAASPEAQETYPYLKFPDLLSPDDFLAQVYMNVFGRAIDADGLAYYKGRLESGESAGSVVYSILGNASTNDGSPDQVYLQNKVDAGLYWANESVDTPSVNIYQDDGFLTDAANASAHQVIEIVSADPKSLAASKATSDTFFHPTSDDGGGGGGDHHHGGSDGSGPPGREFELTTDTDNLTGTGGNDTFHGLYNGGTIADGTTLNTADALNGSSGDDTLTIDVAASTTEPVAPKLTSVENIDVQLSEEGDDTNFAMDLGASIGIEKVSVSRDSNFVGGARFVNVGNIVSAEISGLHDGVLSIRYVPDVVSGESDTQYISIFNSFATLESGNSSGRGIENLVVSSTGADPIYERNGLMLAPRDLKTITVLGDGPLSIGFMSEVNALTTIDASATTGGINIGTLNGGEGISFIGGTGNDTLGFWTTPTPEDHIDGGEGTDTVFVTGGDFSSPSAVAGLNALTSIERIAFDAVTSTYVDGATLTNSDITNLLITNGIFSTFEVTNARDAWTYTFQRALYEANINLTDQNNVFNIELGGDDGLQHVAGDGPYASMIFMNLNLSTQAASDLIAIVNLSSDGDLAAGYPNSIEALSIRTGSVINITGNANLRIDTIISGGVTIDASTFTGGLDIKMSDASSAIVDSTDPDQHTGADTLTLGSGHYRVTVTPLSSGVADANHAGGLFFDTINNFKAGDSGDVLIDSHGVTGIYHPITSDDQAAIDALSGAGATLQAAASIASPKNAMNVWSAFSFQGETYAIAEVNADNDYDPGQDILVHLAGVNVADLTAANFL